MNHELLLSLELLEQALWGFRFRLLVRNHSAVKLLLPLPEVIGLRFAAIGTTWESKWYTGLLVSAASGSFTLDPTGSRDFEWNVRPCSIVRPESNDDYSDYHYHRWCVEIRSELYDVWYRWRVDKDFFDPDSHMRLEDLEYYAEREKAVVWQGETASNRLRVNAA